MELIALSSPDPNRKEIDLIQGLFDAGLDAYHLRKPGASRKQLEAILQPLEAGQRARIVLHGHPDLALKMELQGVHASSSFHKPGLVTLFRRQLFSLRFRSIQRSITCHSLERLTNTRFGFTSLVLSPVFHTISNRNISAGFDEKGIRQALRRVELPVYALGGIDEKTVTQARDMGFSGVILQGTLWRHDRPIESFQEVRMALRKPVHEASPLTVVKPAVRSA
jgi:thiamine-phosphate pyrophosphorylase